MQEFKANTVQKYQNESDEMLIERLRDGERDITDFIMNKYKNLVRSKRTKQVPNQNFGARTCQVVQVFATCNFVAIFDKTKRC